MPLNESFTLADLREVLISCGAIPASLMIDDPSISFLDLGLDSASLLALQVELEQRLNIMLEAEDIPYFNTIQGSLDRINARRG
jgi:acyl carrier protein